tara:strand:- start:659 stop:793 length:135 start_codon:yes stop_codon:yes gene_type:complete
MHFNLFITVKRFNMVFVAVLLVVRLSTFVIDALATMITSAIDGS